MVWTHNYLVRKQTPNHLAKLAKLFCEYLSVRCIWMYVIIMSRTSFRLNPHSVVLLNVKKLLARSRRHIWSLSDSNVIRTHNHLVHKKTLNLLVKLAIWLSCVVRSYLYGAFEYMLFSCHVRVSNSSNQVAVT